ncbi:ABC transporter permease [Parasphaerochaeta coccoides]|uniref:Binding-protein-dependent transport systems inner membrane component n=1 Tax=Parasphaerochaeta coccoides (strain ATCC BAA-1237 / DSM 17374 / SPN1) TaxID=760011 RepID=F4GHS4_PARC1|nr:ABC transporter permease subunit [Parasphaerochaeta coccoides]AEC01612.1 binding-protein-dependent transport systems inner membrane component [Parasphaerochaeta coccoides DSM 17374]
MKKLDNFTDTLTKPTLYHRFMKTKLLWFMLIPVIAYFVLFAYIPMVGIWLAFTKFDFRLGLLKSPFIGLKNFDYLFKSGIFGRLLRNTILYNLAFILGGNIVQIICAVFLGEIKNKRFVKISQSIIFLPYFISYVLVGLFSYALFNIDNGVINTILRNLGFVQYNFYLKPQAWPFIIIAVQIWKGLGYGSVVYLSVISGIDQEIYESARIDGATKWQQISYITLPMIKPTFILLVMFNLGNILKGQFQLFYQLIGNNGLLYNVTDIIDTYVYRSLTVNFDIGMGSAAGVFQSVFGCILVLTVNALVKRFNEDLALF